MAKDSNVITVSTSLFNYPMAICGLSLHLGSSETRKTLEKKVYRTLFILQIYSCFSRRYVPTISVAELFPYTVNPHTTHNSPIRSDEGLRANARNFSFLTRYGGQFTFSI